MITFILSLIPAWSDEFENNNPIIQQTVDRAIGTNENQGLNHNNNVNDINGENPNLIEEEIKEENKENFEKNEKKNPDLEYESEQENENIPMNFKHINLTQPTDEKEEKDLYDSNVSVSEKQLNKSAGVKILNSEIEPIGEKNRINEENSSKNENEYIFPENMNLDNLSYNECFLEQNKKKSNE
jgi:hypothetical protein